MALMVFVLIFEVDLVAILAVSCLILTRTLTLTLTYPPALHR